MDPAPPSSVRRPSRRIQLRRRAALVRAVVASSSSARPAIRRSRIPLLEVAAVFLPRPPLQLVADPAASDPPVADPAPRPSPVACRPPSPPARPPRASSAVAVGAVPTRPRHRAPIRPPLLTPPVYARPCCASALCPPLFCSTEGGLLCYAGTREGVLCSAGEVEVEIFEVAAQTPAAEVL